MPLSPFDIPEIRGRVALHVSVKDALCCIRVSKIFSQDFVYVIWHSIDFDIHQRFVQLPPATINEHGQHVRNIKNLTKQAQLDSLQHLGASRLSSLHIGMTGDPLFQASCYDLIRRNHRTLAQLHMDVATTYNTANYGYGRPPQPSPPFILLDSLTSMKEHCHSSKLTDLTIQQLRLTRDSFTSILQFCPALVAVDLCGTNLINSGVVYPYQHTYVKTLRARIVDVFDEGGFPLLIHFPNLQTWGTSYDPTLSDFPSQTVKDGVRAWCPRLRAIETNQTPGLLLPHLLIDVFVGLTSLMFEYAHISPDLILAILRDPAKWTSLITYMPRKKFYDEFEDDGISEVHDHFQSLGWTLQLIPRFCRRLNTFKFSQHEMNMTEIEHAPWACDDLRHLAVRIRGLDTRNKVDATIIGWRAGKEQKRSGTTVAVPADGYASIESRVIHHLLKFDNVSTIWLGSKVWKS